MTRTRLTTGFHRLGLVLALPFGLLATASLAAPLFYRPADSSAPFTYAVLLGLLGTVVYGTCRAIAWIVGGFMGDPK